MQNPHYITAAEADDRLCPMAKQQQNAEWEYYCDGPKCMAWRWRPAGHQDLMRGYVLPLPLVPEEPMTYGYCGMVRS